MLPLQYGVCRRRGLGRIRHLATADLWIQDRLRTGDFTLEKVLGAENAADMLTKHLNRQLLENHLSTLGVYFEEGRSDLAPTIDHALTLSRGVASDSLIVAKEECRKGKVKGS